MKKDIVRLECDFCGNYDTFDVRESAEKILPVIGRWKGIMDGDSPPNQGADTHRWYCSRECLVSGEEKYDREKKEEQEKQAEQDRAWRKANEAMKNDTALKTHSA